MSKGGRNKRKNSKSPTPRRDLSPKKKKVNIIQSPTNAQAAVYPPATSESSSLTPPQVPANEKTVKPVFVKTNIQVMKNILQTVSFASRPLLKVRGNNSSQVLCFNVDDKLKLINKIKSEKIGYHTFTDPVNKPTYFILKGFYQASCEETLAALQSSKVPAIKVTDFIRNDSYVMYLVHFEKNVNINILNHSHKHVDGIVVKWDIMRKSSKKVTQCFHCQSWGHSATNCGYEPRCVKCSESHEKGACSRTSREGDPKCCNCGGPHSSNHRNCPAYQKHMEMIKTRSKRPSPTIERRAPVPAITSSNFPRLGSQPTAASNNALHSHHPVSFSQLLSESNGPKSNVFEKLTQAQKKLNSLPNINETIDVFVKMVDELSLCNDQKGQLNILLKYTISSSFANNGC